MAAIGRGPTAVLTDWFPDLKGRLVRLWPCHNGPGVFDPERKPCPPIRTASFTPIMVDRYSPRPGDAGSIHDSIPLTIPQRVKLCGLPESFHLPPIEYICMGKTCCAGRRWRIPMLGVSCGNILIPQQGLEILRYCGLPVLSRRDSDMAALPQALICRAETALAYRDAPTDNPDQRLHERLGHAGTNRMLAAVRQGIVLGIKGVTASGIKNLPFCEVCARSKGTS